MKTTAAIHGLTFNNSNFVGVSIYTTYQSDRNNQFEL